MFVGTLFVARAVPFPVALGPCKPVRPTNWWDPFHTRAVPFPVAW